MTNRNRFLSAFICCAMMIVPAMARTNDCANDVFRRQNPDICTQQRTKTVAKTVGITGGTVALIGSAAALIGMSSATSDERKPAPVTTHTTTTRESYSEVGDDVDLARLATVKDYAAYARNSNQYDQIRLSYSLARGYTGKNSNVAVFDSGENAWHGRNVANLITEQVAPDANVVSYTVSDIHGNFKEFNEIGNIISSANDAHIYNFSWSTSGIYANHIHNKNQLIAITDENFVNSLTDAATNNDAIFVWAAGNDAKAQSSAFSALPNIAPETNGHFVNVVAWDNETGALADFSNACGTATMNFCITAPGANLHSQKTSLTLDGTSFAAPIVSAAIAVIREAFPYMNATEVTNLLFTTARDLGDIGVDAIYGHGMLDMERATRPVGATTVPTSDGTNIAMQPARVSSTIAHQIKAANVKFSFVDSFGRAFETNLNDNISVKQRGIGFERLRQSDDKIVKFGNFEFGVKNTDMLMASGLLETESENFISFVGFNNDIQIGKFNLFYNTTIGTMTPHASAESVVSGFSNLTTMSAKLGVKIDNFELSIGTPDTIIDGNMYLNTLHSRDTSGKYIFQKHSIDMTSRPSVEFNASYKFMTAGFVDNPYGTDEFYFLAKTKISF